MTEGGRYGCEAKEDMGARRNRIRVRGGIGYGCVNVGDAGARRWWIQVCVRGICIACFFILMEFLCFYLLIVVESNIHA